MQVFKKKRKSFIYLDDKSGIRKKCSFFVWPYIFLFPFKRNLRMGDCKDSACICSPLCVSQTKIFQCKMVYFGLLCFQALYMIPHMHVYSEKPQLHK